MMETIHEESFEDDYRSQQQVPSVSQTENAERTVPQNGFYNVGYHETPQSRKAPLRMKRPPRFEAPKPPVPTQNHQTQIPTAQLEIVDRLGEGAFGEVLLVQDKSDPTILLAVKCIDLNNMQPGQVEQVRREALLQRMVSSHENVIRYVSMRVNMDEVFQIFLEYAGGGELFDQIEPDVGLEPDRAQLYFRQLISGLEYIHSFGVVHRDIKPENLLLDKTHQILKIADFGMATIFKHDGKERVLDTQCGTAPYAAPEVFGGKYRGEPIDIWSAGVVLVAMLVGELPWERPMRDCDEYVRWVDFRDIKVRPWSRMRNEELAILRNILNENPKHRATIARIKRHPYFIKNHEDAFSDTFSPHFNGSKRRRIELEESNSPSTTSSQPPAMKFMRTTNDTSQKLVSPTHNKKICRGGLPKTSFTQPPNFESLLIAKSQLNDGSQANSSHPLQIVRRLTRFCVTVELCKAIENVIEACRRCNYEAAMKYNNQLFVTSMVSTEGPSFMVSFFKMIDAGEQLILIDFRRSKGDGLEFKRRFVKIKKMLNKIVYKNPIDWLGAQGAAAQITQKNFQRMSLDTDENEQENIRMEEDTDLPDLLSQTID